MSMSSLVEICVHEIENNIVFRNRMEKINNVEEVKGLRNPNTIRRPLETNKVGEGPVKIQYNYLFEDKRKIASLDKSFSGHGLYMTMDGNINGYKDSDSDVLFIPYINQRSGDVTVVFVGNEDSDSVEKLSDVLGIDTTLIVREEILSRPYYTISIARGTRFRRVTTSSKVNLIFRTVTAIKVISNRYNSTVPLNKTFVASIIEDGILENHVTEKLNEWYTKKNRKMPTETSDGSIPYYVIGDGKTGTVKVFYGFIILI